MGFCTCKTKRGDSLFHWVFWEFATLKFLVLLSNSNVLLVWPQKGRLNGFILGLIVKLVGILWFQFAETLQPQQQQVTTIHVRLLRQPALPH